MKIEDLSLKATCKENFALLWSEISNFINKSKSRNDVNIFFILFIKSFH